MSFQLQVTHASGAVDLLVFPSRLLRALTVIALAARPCALRLLDPQS